MTGDTLQSTDLHNDTNDANNAAVTAVRPVAIAIALSSLIVAILLAYFHDRFWWPVDEGVYGYVAQRILAGDTLHVDLIDHHAGYVNYLHAGALAVFGTDFLSLRYPLVLLTLVQAVIAGWLLAPRGLLAAFLAPLIVGAFSYVQFLNPSANWYALFFFFVTCVMLTRFDPARGRDAIVIGLLLGLCFLFRQLSGVMLAMGTLAWLLVRLPSTEPSKTPRLARGLLIVMALGIAGYLYGKGSVTGLVLFGLWPLGLLVLAWNRVAAPDGDVARLIGWLMLGVVIAAAPLAVHNLISGAFAGWLRDLFVTPMMIDAMPFIREASYATIALIALNNLLTAPSTAALLNAPFWLALLAAPPVLGIVLLRRLSRATHSRPSPLPVLAVFYAMVALHYHIPHYLFYATAPVLLALLFFAAGAGTAWKGTVAGGMLAMSVVALTYQADQPLDRGLRGAVDGTLMPLDATGRLPNASLQISEFDRRIYQKVFDRIEDRARPGEMLFTVPMDPEFNFMTGRRAPVPYSKTALGIRNEKDVETTLQALVAAAPLFVIHRPGNKYMTPLSMELINEIRRRSPPPERIGPFDLYRLSIEDLR